MKKKQLLIVVAKDWFFLSHRLPIAKEAIIRGWDVTVATSDTGRFAEINSYGIKTINLLFNSSGTNPLREIKTVISLIRIYRTLAPDLIHLVAIKPCIYGSLAAKILRKKNVINAITGLGCVFIGKRRRILRYVVEKMIGMATGGKNFYFIFQNKDDAEFISSINKLDKNKSFLIKGCGVDMNIYSYQFDPKNKKVRFILPARLLYDKGISEFADAALRIKEKAFGKAEFVFVGGIDRDNPEGISEDRLKDILIPDYLIWIGYSSNMLSTYKDSNVVVLPSYREGLPKALIEASAIGRPIITTDAPGCKECVIDGYNGFIVPVKDSVLLSEYMIRFIEDKNLRIKMGESSRILAEKEFSVDSFLNKTFFIYDKILNQQLVNVIEYVYDDDSLKEVS